jgi:hypothetical protein
VFERAQFTCECCGSTSNQLHAHHKVYLRGRKPWEYDDELLECLCDPCHAEAHENLEELYLAVAEFPSADLPIITQVILADLSASVQNHLQDAADARLDFRRGSCS